MEGIPTAFILCHPTDGEVDEEEDAVRVSLLHIVIQFPTRLGNPPMQWDTRTFDSKGDVFFGRIVVLDWDERYTRQIRVAKYIPTAASIGVALAADLDILLFGLFDAVNSDFNAGRVLFAVYVPPLFVPIMLAGYLTPLQAWTSLRAVIVSTGQEVGCRDIVEWLRVKILRGAVDQRSILSIQDPTAPLANANLLLHWQTSLIRDGLNSMISRLQGMLAVANISDLVIEHLEN